MTTIRVASRESRLAVIQAQTLAEAIEAACPHTTVELVTMKTTGDRILDRTLDQVGGKGLFVKELDAALLEGRAEFAVHSMKDLPMEIHPRLPLAAVSRRADPRDVLVLPQGQETWDRTAVVGCASQRRALQLRRLYPGLRVEPVRGNVLTRLRKLDGGAYGALVLAAAGLKRLGLEHRISRFFSPEELLPAAGQGILAVQARAGVDLTYLDAFHDPGVWFCAQAERAFVRALDGGCSSPVAAYALLEEGTLRLEGMNAQGVRGWIAGSPEEAQALGAALAEELR